MSQTAIAPYTNKSHESIVATLNLLRWYRAFIASDKERAHDPMGHPYDRNIITKAEARHTLTWLINVAINRKAGIPDVVGRKQDSDYQRGLRQDKDRANTPRLIVRRFTTPELNQRLQHRLYTEEDF